jgi:hypothetical protein
MTRKDSEKDSERPHYYSQFWLDVAAGRRIIGAPRPNEETDSNTEPEPVPVSLRRPTRASSSVLSDGYAETLSHPEVEEEEIEDLVEPELDELDLDNEIDESEIPPAEVDESEIPDVDFAALDLEDEAVPEIEDEEEEIFPEEEEEDDELGWSGRGRKKPKPGRQQKAPKKPIKRDSRRGF